MLSPTEASLLAALVGLVSIVVTAFVMKGNSDSRYVTKEQCATERQLQCAERAALRDRFEKFEKGLREDREAMQEQITNEMSSVKHTLRIALNMCRALVTHSSIPPEQKTAILNNDGGSK